MLPHSDLLQLKRWNTPTIYNGWEQITSRDVGFECFNLEETHDFMPQMGPMVGYAVTLVIEPSNAGHRSEQPEASGAFFRYVAEQPGPKIVVVQDLDKPRVLGSLLMRGVDIILVLPFLPLLIILAAYLGRSLLNTTVIIGLVIWAGTARVIRAQVLTIAQQDYVLFARTIGASDTHIILRHILPQVLLLAMGQFVLAR